MRIYILALLFSLLFSGCGKSGRFKNGDIVRIKLDGRIGMLVTRDLSFWRVRFSCNPGTTLRESGGGNIKPQVYITELMLEHEFELMEKGKEKS